MIKNRDQLARSEQHGHALDAVEAGIDAAQPRTVIEEKLDVSDGVLSAAGDEYDLCTYENIYVLGGGNAGGQVAAALESLLGDQIDDGIGVTDDPAPTTRIRTVEGTHPLPSRANVEGTRQLLELADAAGENDLVFAVISGGGSALMCAPDETLSLDEYRNLTEKLLRSGATIDEINAVRKHLSTFKGGQFARRIAPATTVGLLFSDVVGNRLDVIASGPTAPDPTTYDDWQAVVDRYDLALPDSARRLLDEGLAGDRRETPTASDTVFDRVRNYVLADGRTALGAARQSLRGAGYTAVILSAEMEGEARDVGTIHASIGTECLGQGEPFEPPVALLSGGETTVTVEGDGRGGPNQEFALSAALSLTDGIVVAGVDTDGIDGSSDVAGGLVDASTVTASDRNPARSALRNNDAYPYLDAHNGLVRTGPTGTNVNDLRVVLVDDAGDYRPAPFYRSPDIGSQGSRSKDSRHTSHRWYRLKRVGLEPDTYYTALDSRLHGHKL
jgi:hydroxypyruvate reductase